MQLFMRNIISKGSSPHLTAQIDIADIVASEPSIHSGGPLQADADATAGSDHVIVTGQVEGQLAFICSRCLTVFASPLKLQFEEHFSTEPEEEQADELDDDVIVNYVTEDKVDLIPYIKEHIVLALPRFPLCEADCKGLCPSCGISRNTDTCSCNTEKTDPRWSGLKDLFQP